MTDLSELLRPLVEQIGAGPSPDEIAARAKSRRGRRRGKIVASAVAVATITVLSLTATATGTGKARIVTVGLEYPAPTGARRYGGLAPCPRPHRRSRRWGTHQRNCRRQQSRQTNLDRVRRLDRNRSGEPKRSIYSGLAISRLQPRNPLRGQLHPHRGIPPQGDRCHDLPDVLTVHWTSCRPQMPWT